MKRQRTIAPTVLATARDYVEFVSALRARRDALRVTDATLDGISGLPDRYVQKLLCHRPSKAIGLTSMGPLLGALGLALLIVHDNKALKRVENRLVRRKHRKVHTAVSTTLITVETAGEMVRRRLAKVPPRRRAAIARKAALMRWRKPRLIEITDKVKRPTGELV